VNAEVRSSPVERAPGVGCFFSGGVDSFYTLLKHRQEVTHIIFVHGFDIALEEKELRSRASRMAQEVARELGVTLIEVETNLRSFSDKVVGWGKYHGAAMASVALLFQHRFSKVLIAATNSYAELTP
jgi:asparagine synthetase B (glutamine-hydrolysing)